MNLNDSQKRTVEHFDGPCLCLAGPGSGKTAVLTCRIKRLIDRGVAPESICVLTFTKAAATEMKDRFLAMSEMGGQVVFGTFHSLFWGILRQEYGLKADSILTGQRRISLLREAALISKVDIKDNDEIVVYGKEISAINCFAMKPEDYQSKDVDNTKLRQIYYSFEKLKYKYKVYEFEDMLTKAYEMFLANPEILTNWQNRFSYYLIDEMQDMNEVQYNLMKLLSDKASNIFCVGDDDQSIYGFRGAKPGLMQDFLRDYPDAVQIVLNKNYRCPANVLAAASRVINKNEDRLSKELMSNKVDGKIEIRPCRDIKDEAINVVDEIKRLRDSGNSLENIAVLYRNHANVGYVLEALIEADIPFYLKEQMPNIYTHFVFEDLLDFFQIAIGNATRARILNVMNKPNKYIQRQAVEDGYSFDDMMKFYRGNQMMEQKIEGFRRDINLISRMTPFAAVNYIRQGIGYERYVMERCLEKGKDTDELIDVLNLFSESVRECKTLSKAIDRISFLKLKVDYENKNRNNSKNGRVGLYTLHSSKGLEFDNVFIIGANDTIIPTKRASTKSDIEGERRLFYVGVTRAKENLYISYYQNKNKDKMYPSRFILEMDS